MSVRDKYLLTEEIESGNFSRKDFEQLFTKAYKLQQQVEKTMKYAEGKKLTQTGKLFRKLWNEVGDAVLEIGKAKKTYMSYLANPPKEEPE